MQTNNNNNTVKVITENVVFTISEGFTINSAAYSAWAAGPLDCRMTTSSVRGINDIVVHQTCCVYHFRYECHFALAC